MVTQRSTASTLKRAVNKHPKKTALRGPRAARGAPGHQGNDFGGVSRRMVNSQVALKGGRSTLELSVAASRVREKGGGQREEWRTENRVARRMLSRCNFTESAQTSGSRFSKKSQRHSSQSFPDYKNVNIYKAFGVRLNAFI